MLFDVLQLLCFYMEEKDFGLPVDLCEFYWRVLLFYNTT